MIICEVCKTENEEHFSFCKNCGSPIKTQEVKSEPKPQAKQELVPVYMMLPDINNPCERTLQKVFVTPAQFGAMKAAGMFKNKEENNE